MRRFFILFATVTALAVCEPITRESVEKRLAGLKEAKEQAVANLNAMNGAIQDCQFWLDQLAAKPEASKREAPKPPQPKDAAPGHPRTQATKE